MSVDDCAANAASYVLGALDDGEYESFRAHLETCAVCREEVAALQLVADALPAVAPSLSAPPELKGRIMADVESEAGWQRVGATHGAGSRPPRRSPRRRWALGAGAFAAAAAVIAIAIAVLPAGGGSSTRVISAHVLAPHATASLRLNGSHAEIDIAGMPQSPPGHVYEVWVKRAGAPQPTDALFTVTAGGRATVGVPGGVAGASAVMVTAEPLGGSRVPTSAPVIVANVG